MNVRKFHIYVDFLLFVLMKGWVSAEVFFIFFLDEVCSIFTGRVLRANYMFIYSLPVVTRWDHMEFQQTVSKIGYDCATKISVFLHFPDASRVEKETPFPINAFCFRGRVVPPQRE